MSRYSVTFGYMGSRSRDFNEFADVLRFCEIIQAQGGFELCVIGESYDCDCDEDGYHVIDDGLTAEEREAIEQLEHEERVAS